MCEYFVGDIPSLGAYTKATGNGHGGLGSSILSSLLAAKVTPSKEKRKEKKGGEGEGVWVVFGADLEVKKQARNKHD